MRLPRSLMIAATLVGAFSVAGLICVACVIYVARTTPFQPSPYHGPPRQLGIVPDGVNDYSDPVYADALKHARGFCTPDVPYASTDAVPLDPEGWPQADFGVLIATGDKYHGRYTVSFTGQAVPEKFVTQGTLALKYDPATNVTSGTFDVAADNPGLAVYLVFRWTHRRPDDTGITGITNLKIMRPIAPGAMESHRPDEMWDRRFLQTLSIYSILRNLDLQRTNSFADPSPLRWEMRTSPANPIQSRVTSTVGIAIEHQILMANVHRQNLWLCVPDTATDDYIRKLALTCRFGSDGVNPYIEPQANPVYPPLIGKPYFEFSNEVWNYILGPQTERNRHAAEAMAISDPKKIFFGHDPATVNTWYRGYRHYGLQVLRLRNLVGEALGEDGFNRDFFTVLSGQFGTNPPLTEALAAIKAADRRPLNQVVSFAGGFWYAGFNNTDPGATVDQVFAGGIKPFPHVLEERSILEPLGIPSAHYEGGLVFGDGKTTPLSNAVDADPRMEKYYGRVVADRFADHSSILMVYSDRCGAWAVSPDNNTAMPKYRALVQATDRLKTTPKSSSSAAGKSGP